MFDLEKAIKEWKKGFHKHEALEDALTDDMEWHLRETVTSMSASGISPREAFRLAVEQVGHPPEIAAEYAKNRELALDRRTPWRPARFLPALWWNTIKTAWRMMRRQAFYSLANAGGLSISLALVFTIALWVRNELGYDCFHAGYQSIYRIVMQGSGPDAAYSAGSTPGRFSSAAEQCAGVLACARMRLQASQLFKAGGKAMYEGGGAFVDPAFLTMFSFPLCEGDRQTALNSPDSMTVCRSFAGKYFGPGRAVGKTVEFMGRPFRITGVLEDPPANSSFRFDFLCSLKLLENDPFIPVDWYSDYFYTFVQIRDMTSLDRLQNRLQQIILEQAPEFARTKKNFLLQPLNEIHLEENFRYEDIETGSRPMVAAFSGVIILVLLIAIVNFVNLSTARATSRAKEVSIRKLMGSNRGSLILQFFGESLLLTLLAGFLAIILVRISLPEFNTLFSTSLQLDFSQNGLLAGFAGIVLLTALAAGAYPAWFLSAPEINGITGRPPAAKVKTTALRSALLVFQFAISLFLLISAATIHHQLGFMLGHETGFDKRQVVSINAREISSSRYLALKDRLLRQREIMAVSAAAGPPTERTDGGPAGFSGLANGVQLNFETMNVDADFFNLMHMKALAGRPFSSNYASDTSEACMINETGARLLGGVRNVVGKKIQLSNGRPRTIVGVAGDSHFKSLHSAIDPLALRPLTNPLQAGSKGIVLVKLAGIAPEAELTMLRKVWEAEFPEHPFDYHYIEDDYSRQYAAEIRSRSLAGIFTAAAIFISCLGLFGLAMYNVRQRTREIGIRKAIGASGFSIFGLLARRYGGWIVWANIIAWPAAYLFLSRWLQTYPYRIAPPLTAFLYASLTTTCIALFTAGLATFRAARTRPADSLRCE